MSPTIDIYNCPINAYAPHRVPLAYMAAVMQAASEHKPVQIHIRNQGWFADSFPSWDWARNDYRIDPASRPVAPSVFKVGDYVVCFDGPDIHTNGVRLLEDARPHADGDQIISFNGFGVLSRRFRLARPDEIRASLIEQAAQKGFVVGAHVTASGSRGLIHELAVWLPEDIMENRSQSHLVTEAQKRHKPFVYAYYGSGCVAPIDNLTVSAPKQTKKVPMESSDYPAVFWVRRSHVDEASLVTYINGRGDMDSDDERNTKTPTILMYSYEYSADRLNWKPCYKTVEVSS